MIFDRHANMKYKYGNRFFWYRGYYVDAVGRIKRRSRGISRTSNRRDIANDQISIKELIDPFTGEPVKGARNNPKGARSTGRPLRGSP